MDVQVSVLGPLKLAVDGRLATPSARKPRQLLSLLVLDVNQTISIPALTRGLWDDSPPRSAETTIQTYIVQLRRLLRVCLGLGPVSAKEIVTTTDCGYAFELGGGRHDLLEFRRFGRVGAAALSEGDPLRAAEFLHKALSCWSGRALSDVHPSRLLEGEVRRLEDSWLRAQEQCMDADLRLGRHAEILDGLAELCLQFRCNEKLHLGYLLALYRSGLRIEALAVYREFRRNLVEVLGLEPANSLGRLNEIILRAEPRLDEICLEAPLGIARELLASPLLSSP